MKSTNQLAVGVLATLLSVGFATADNHAEKPSEECLKLGEAVEDAVKAQPSTVLAHVSAKVSETPACACEIVKGAIKGAKADEELTGQIVEAAVRAAPAKYKVIVECAVAVNPKAAGHIRAALQRVFGGKGKGKVVVVEPPEEVGMNPALIMAFILQGLPPSFIGVPGVDPALPPVGINPPNDPPVVPPEVPEEPEEPEDRPRPPFRPPVTPGTPAGP